MDSYSLADCAARGFAEWRTSKHPRADDAKCRQYLREAPVRALRYLWRTGDAQQRRTVAARVAIWMEKPDTPKLSMRVYERETRRAL